MAKKKQQSPAELVNEMNQRGLEQILPGTDRKVRIRTLDAPSLLREGKMPDILTPLVIKSVYQELSDREVREFLGQPKLNVDDALAMLETIDFVVEQSIADSTKVKDLTLGEKRWIFRLAMGPAELLITFRSDEEPDVEPVVEEQDVQQVAE